jgi:hypothetical protein
VLEICLRFFARLSQCPRGDRAERTVSARAAATTFFPVPRELAVEALVAAHYLDCPPLVRHCCRRVAEAPESHLSELAALPPSLLAMVLSRLSAVQLFLVERAIPHARIAVLPFWRAHCERQWPGSSGPTPVREESGDAAGDEPGDGGMFFQRMFATRFLAELLDAYLRALDDGTRAMRWRRVEKFCAAAGPFVESLRLEAPRGFSIEALFSDAPRVVGLLASLPNVRELVVSQAGAGGLTSSAACSAVASAVAKLGFLERVRLCASSVDLRFIGRELGNRKSVESLEIRGRLHAHTLRHLSELAASSSSGLRDWAVEESELGERGASALLQALAARRDVRSLSLRACGIEMREASADLSAAVGSFVRSSATTLRRLDLSQNFLGDVNVVLLRALGEAPCTRLEELNLSWNALTRDAVAALVVYAAQPRIRLSRLELESCAVDSASADLLAALLSRPAAAPNLRSLNLSNNFIASDSLVRLCTALAANTTLREMILQRSLLKRKRCAEAMLRALHGNATLRTLALQDNELAEDAAELQALARAVAPALVIDVRDSVGSRE